MLNTIQMAILNRRRDIEVMKLVGATNWFIRIPFMVEGLIQGLIGSLFAIPVTRIFINDLETQAEGAGRGLLGPFVGHRQPDHHGLAPPHRRRRRRQPHRLRHRGQPLPQGLKALRSGPGGRR